MMCRTSQGLRSCCTRDRDHTHPRRKASTDPRWGIFDHDALGGRYAKTVGGAKIALRIGLSLADVSRSDQEGRDRQRGQSEPQACHRRAARGHDGPAVRREGGDEFGGSRYGEYTASLLLLHAIQ
jgi:hypothetical protein